MTIQEMIAQIQERIMELEQSIKSPYLHKEMIFLMTQTLNVNLEMFVEFSLILASMPSPRSWG